MRTSPPFVPRAFFRLCGASGSDCVGDGEEGTGEVDGEEGDGRGDDHYPWSAFVWEMGTQGWCGRVSGTRTQKCASRESWRVEYLRGSAAREV